MESFKEHFLKVTGLTEHDLYLLLEKSFKDERYEKLLSFLNTHNLMIKYDENLKDETGISVNGYIDLKNSIITINWLNAFLDDFYAFSRTGILGDIYSPYKPTKPSSMDEIMLYSILKVLFHEYKHYLQYQNTDNSIAMLNCTAKENKIKINILEEEAHKYEERVNEYFSNKKLKILEE